MWKEHKPSTFIKTYKERKIDRIYNRKKKTNKRVISYQVMGKSVQFECLKQWIEEFDMFYS